MLNGVLDALGLRKLPKIIFAGKNLKKMLSSFLQCIVFIGSSDLSEIRGNCSN